MFPYSVWVHESGANYPNPYHARGEWECVAEAKHSRLACAAALNEIETNPRRFVQVWKRISPGDYIRIAGYNPLVADQSGKPKLKIHEEDA